MNLEEHKYKIFFGVVGLVVLLFTAHYFGFFVYLQQQVILILEWVSGLGRLAPFVFLSFYVLATLITIPGTILSLGGGFLFGILLGSVVVSMGATLGATCSFLVGRYVLRDWVSEKIKTKPKFTALNNAVTEEGGKIVLLTRLSPIFPFNLLNYGFGVTQVALKDYVFGTWLGTLPGTIILVYLGSLTQNIADLGNQEQPSALQWTIRILGFTASIGVAIYVARVAKKALQTKLKEDS